MNKKRSCVCVHHIATNITMGGLSRFRSHHCAGACRKLRLANVVGVRAPLRSPTDPTVLYCTTNIQKTNYELQVPGTDNRPTNTPLTARQWSKSSAKKGRSAPISTNITTLRDCLLYSNKQCTLLYCLHVATRKNDARKRTFQRSQQQSHPQKRQYTNATRVMATVTARSTGRVVVGLCGHHVPSCLDIFGHPGSLPL
jgi:hypothetical protein